MIKKNLSPNPSFDKWRKPPVSHRSFCSQQASQRTQVPKATVVIFGHQYFILLMVVTHQVENQFLLKP